MQCGVVCLCVKIIDWEKAIIKVVLFYIVKEPGQIYNFYSLKPEYIGSQKGTNRLTDKRFIK